jgi:hypothetical protein
MSSAVLRPALLGLFTCLLLASGGGSTESAQITQNKSGSSPPYTTALLGWVLVWQDEFDVPGLPDSHKWDFDTEYNKRG